MRTFPKNRLRWFHGELNFPGLYGGLYGQNLPYKFKNSYGDFQNRNFETSHRTQIIEIKIRTSSRNKAQLVLLRDEVRILIFDDPTELEKWQRPVMVRSGRGPFKPARPRRARAMHNFFSKLYEIPRATAARA